VLDIFARLVEREGRSVIAVTHDPELARHSQRRLSLVDGRTVEPDTAPRTGLSASAVTEI